MGRPKGSKNKTRKGTASSRSQTQNTERPMMGDEVAVIITFAVSVFLFLSNLGLCGPVGAVLRSVQLGLFGTIGYIFPLVLLLVVVFILSNLDNPYAAFRMTAALFMLIFLSAVLQFASGGVKDMSLGDFYTEASDQGSGGGVIGGALAMVLYGMAGQVGAVLILLAAILVCLVYITEKPLARMFAAGSIAAASKAKDRAKEDFSLMAENARQHREERLRQKEERDKAAENARGVDFNAINLTGEPEGELPFEESPVRLTEPEGSLPEVSLFDTGKTEADKTLPAEDGEIELPLNVKHERFAPAETDTAAAKTDDFPEFDISGQGYEKPEVPSEDIPGMTSGRPDAKAADAVQIPAADLPQRNTASAEISGSRQDAPQPAGMNPESGTRRIVTSTGKIIEADVETVQKKVEQKRAEAASDSDNLKVQQEILRKKAAARPYRFPPLELLKKGGVQDTDSREEIRKNALTLQQTLKSFGVGVTVTNVSVGPAVTRYELQPEQGVKVSKIVALTNDIKMRLAAADIRIEAPIPGKSAVGIEVPNRSSQTVYLGDIIQSQEFRSSKAKLAFGVGKDIAGKIVVTDIAKMPHLLIAGATGSGKSVSINTLIMSIVYKYRPDEVRLMMIDPKVVELQVYNGIPHLLIPVVTDPKKAAAALNWAVAEMTERYRKFAETGARDLKGYNEKVEEVIRDPEVPEDQKPEKLPQIIIIIDELADLMMVSAQEVEDSICRIAQLARAAGMHLVIATQRPSVNVITGLIKANVPSRIAFAVSSGVDSRTIIDMNGAEKLLGKGDMLFFPQGIPKPIRCQGAFVSDQEVQEVVDFLKQNGEADYKEDIQSTIQTPDADGTGGSQDDRDDLFQEAGALIIESDKASIGMLQRRFRIGFNRAARIMDQLAEAQVVGPEEGTKPRRILMSMEEFEQLAES